MSRGVRLVGLGIVKGLIETARNFIGSYRDPRRLVTVEYPEVRLPPVERARTFPMLVYDGADPEAGLRCVACKICEKECPPQCIYIEADRDARGRVLKRPRVFDVDCSVCMGCQICAEVCPFDAIKMNTEYELAVADRFGGLLLRKSQLVRSTEYHRTVHPQEAVEIDAQVAQARARAEAKARAGGGG
ncbi:MAG TPA: 4Fe-4S dicluster domain-containing protein [Verrucomicrobiota bacterium]|nr:4Fe-4S dicluster domain-containing protein [Verrucomicrobiota bacterium]HNU51540.1 4Fe-4S dicluster domain-containing protein [Verrucomicrobiota bacterium]